MNDVRVLEGREEIVAGSNWKVGSVRVACAVVAVVGVMMPAMMAQGKAKVKHGMAKPQLTGTDGSTGTAKFQGNLTTLSAPSGQVMGMALRADCSLSFATSSYSLSTTSTDNVTGTIVPHYERTLHTEAGLASTPDVFAGGCVPQVAGLGSTPGLFVGTTTTGVNVFAGIGYDPMAMTNGLYVTTGKSASDYALSVFGFATANVMATADLNKDGNNDLVVTNSVGTSSGSVSVLMGKADGTFQTAVSYPTAGSGTIAAVIDDVNGDGKLDIVAVSSALANSGPVEQQISVLLGKGDGTFNAAQSFTAPALPGYTTEASTPIANLITASLRGNGKKDLVGSNGAVFLGNGDGTFTASTTPAFPYQADSLSSSGPYLAGGDLNKDGKVDLVVGNGSLATYYGNGDGTFTAGPTYASIGNNGEVSVSDIDGDGSLDIYNGLANGGVYVGDGDYPNLSYALMGYGDGTFSGAPYVTGTGVYSAYDGTNMGDVNGDGLPDLIALGSYADNVQNSTFTVYTGSSMGIFKPGATINIPASVVLNGTTITGANLGIVGYAVGDINGDGKADLVFVTNNASTLSYSGLIYWTVLNNGDGTFATPVPHEMPSLAPAGDNDSSTQTIAGLQIAPLNKGGKASILFSFYENVYTTQNVYLYGFMVLPGNGDGTFGTPVTTYSLNSTTAPARLVTEPQIVTVADFNNDGKEDLLAVSLNGVNSANNPQSAVQVYLGNGDGTFDTPKSVATATSVAGTAVPCAVADFNKDGKLDLACPGADANANAELAISLGNGDGTFGTPTLLALTGGVPSNQGGIEGGIAAADFDGDGNADVALFVFNSYSGIFYGKGDGTFTSVNSGSGLVPKDLINLAAGGTSVAVDLNGDGKPDILAGSTVLLNQYGAAGVTLANTTTGLSASATAITLGSSVTLTATVVGAAGSTGTPTGAVTFYDGTTQLGQGTLSGGGVATYMTTALGVGSHSLTAVYAGDTNFNGSTSAAVTVMVSGAATPVGTSTALTASASSVVSGTSVTFTATVTAASGTAVPTGTVTFLDGTTTLGTGMLNGSGVATYATNALGVGGHSITASYGAVTGFSASTSMAVSVTVSAAVAPSFAVAIAPGSGTVTAGGAASATISVTAAGGFSSGVSLACAGAPANATCTVSPGSVTPSGSAAATATLTVQTNVAVMSARGSSLPSSKGYGVLVCGASLLGWTLIRRRRKGWWFVQVGLALMLLGAGVMTGCGGSGNAKNKTPTGTYTLTVTGTSGSAMEAATYSLTVQ